VKAQGFDWDAFRETVGITVRFLDNLIDVSGFPTQDFENMARKTRPIGVGMMGLADALVLLGLPYDSDEGILWSREIARQMTRYAIMASCEIAQEKGTFPAYTKDKNVVLGVANRFFHPESAEEFKDAERVIKHGLRNSHWTTIAPTGSISISADCSQGMEPHFAICFDKHLSDTHETLTFVNPIFENLYKKESWYATAIKKIAENHGSCQGIPEIPKAVQELWRCAHDISWINRVTMQSQLQEGISNSISSTINLPSTAPVQQVRDIYLKAFETGCKGITIYRDGSHADQPVSFGKAKEKVCAKPIARPRTRTGTTHEINTGHGKIYITVNRDDAGRVFEIFTNGGKNGSVNAANLEAIARVISIALQEGVHIDSLARTLININDGTAMWDRLSDSDERPVQITSVPDAIGKLLTRFYVSDACVEPELPGTAGKCPDCNSPMFMKEGCAFCPQCGSKCS
jgi:ribonucleoside-diphosphate reductase alpha chain